MDPPALGAPLLPVVADATPDADPVETPVPAAGGTSESWVNDANVRRCAGGISTRIGYWIPSI